MFLFSVKKGSAALNSVCVLKWACRCGSEGRVQLQFKCQGECGGGAVKEDGKRDIAPINGRAEDQDRGRTQSLNAEEPTI